MNLHDGMRFTVDPPLTNLKPNDAILMSLPAGKQFTLQVLESGEEWVPAVGSARHFHIHRVADREWNGIGR